ncbi:MAG TPA: NUDIX hydrolase [Bacillales bacterium]|nr:NUDIX hydrolase [Bacillales bacterium]
MSHLLQVRVTGILIEDERLLLVRQKVSESRNWSLPGGRVEAGETLEEALMREIMEETGLHTKVVKLLYVCDVPEANPALIHVTFLVRSVGGELTLPSNALDDNPISAVKKVPITDLINYGFTERFCNCLRNGFPGSGDYMGHKKNIGL